MEGLSGLKPVGGIQSLTGSELRITAGNSCPTNDGVSAALLMTENKARALGLTPLARIIGMGVGGVKPQVMGLGPIPSTRKACFTPALRPTRSTASSSTRRSPRR